MIYLLEFASTSLAIAIVATALFLLQRSSGIPLLEIIPFATGVALLVLSSMHNQSASTIHNSSLFLPTLVCAGSAIALHPRYVRWRLRIAGESTTLLMSFASMNFWLLLLSVATDAHPTTIRFADLKFIGSKEHLELVIVVLATLFLIGIVSYLRRVRLTAALQLAKDDYRLLESFGRRADYVRRHIFVVTTGICAAGAILFIALQDNFSVLNSYSILVPAFAISISQSRFRLIRLITASFVLAACVQLMTQYTSEILRDFHQSFLFILFVVAGTTVRWFIRVGLADWFQRYTIARVRGLIW